MRAQSVDSQPILVRALAKFLSETVNTDSSNHDLVRPIIPALWIWLLALSWRATAGSRREYSWPMGMTRVTPSHIQTYPRACTPKEIAIFAMNLEKGEKP